MVASVLEAKIRLLKKFLFHRVFDYLIMDSAVAPHDKIDVSRQLTQTMEFSFRNVHGNIIDLYGAHVGFSMILVTMD